MGRFANRTDAGGRLGEALVAYAGRPDVIVLGLPRGGIPVGAEVARRLQTAFDVFLVRKLGVWGHEELAMGAIAEGGVQVLDHQLIAALGIPSALVDQVVARERAELGRRARSYRGARNAPDIAGRTAILVDDGFATGATMEAAIAAARLLRPGAIIAAAPVGAPSTVDRLRALADDVVCVMMPRRLDAVGLWYDDFRQTTDDEVRQLLGLSRDLEPQASNREP
jgi:predicted phosphoribosyltransferase